MLPKENRLKKQKDIQKVFKEGKGLKEDFLFLKLVKNDLQVSRFGFVVGKNTAKKAAGRNRIKRQIRETTRARLPKIKIGFDAVLVALRGSVSRRSEEIEATTDKLLKKAKLL